MLGGLAVLSFLGTFAAVRLLLLPFGQFALDEPNARSLHERPVPRTGGIGVLLGGAISLGFGAVQLWLPMIIALCLAVVSFLDDLRGMPTGVRLLSHFAAAALLVYYTLAPMHPAELTVLIVAVVWITNLYNFMDGSDGLAAGMTVIGLGAYGLAAYAAGNMPLVALSLALAAASAAFLIHNFHPARIFLGDVGSIPLGFLAAALGIVGWRDDSWPLWFPVLVFAPFIGDATITLAKRVLRGERVWQPHREHYYQRMVRMGLGHRGTALMVACVVAALFGRSQAGTVQGAVFLGAAVALVLMALWVDIRWARFIRAAELRS